MFHGVFVSKDQPLLRVNLGKEFSSTDYCSAILNQEDPDFQPTCFLFGVFQGTHQTGFTSILGDENRDIPIIFGGLDRYHLVNVYMTKIDEHVHVSLVNQL